MLARVEQEPPKVRWYLDSTGLHMLIPGGAFLSVSMRCLELMGYDPTHPGRALKKLVDDGHAVMIPLPAERGGIGPLLRLTPEETASLMGEYFMPIGKGFRPIEIPAERWGRA